MVEGAALVGFQLGEKVDGCADGYALGPKEILGPAVGMTDGANVDGI